MLEYLNRFFSIEITISINFSDLPILHAFVKTSYKGLSEPTFAVSIGKYKQNLFFQLNQLSPK
jgi:hypothetical protein